MNVIPLDPSLVKGSHGRITDDPADGPLLMSSEPKLLETDGIGATDSYPLLLRHILPASPEEDRCARSAGRVAGQSWRFPDVCSRFRRMAQDARHSLLRRQGSGQGFDQSQIIVRLVPVPVAR
ncbi:MAG: hypothetical protein WDA20_01435 [Desulfuromonadales bacterium]